MLDPENASQSSVESDRQSDIKSAAPTPSEEQEEDPPSLQMLEESAAQLAALRQRAENRLDQLSSGSEAPPANSVWTEGQPLRPRTTEDDAGKESVVGPPLPFESDAALPSVTLRPETDAPWEFDAEAADMNSVGQFSEPPVPLPKAPLTDRIPSPYVAPQQHDASQAPQSPERPDRGSSEFPRPSIDAQPNAAPRSVGYPIQKYHAQPSSILDTPVGAALPVSDRMAATRPDATPADAQLIEEEIVQLCEAINRVLETRQGNTGHALSLLREARQIISAEPQRLERAEYNIQQARQILDRARFRRHRSRSNALRTVGLLVLWLAVLGVLGASLYFYQYEIDEFARITTPQLGWNAVRISPALWVVVTGGIGGCLGAVSLLLERIRLYQEFDRQYTLGSAIQPLMGVLLGLAVYGLLAGLFNSLGTSITVHPVTTYLPAAIALPIGFWQVYVYALIFRFTRLLTYQRRRRW